MFTAKFDPQSFFQRTENVALHVPASEVFSLLKRSIDLPPQWGALIRREAGDQSVISAGGVIDADNVEDILFVRLAAIELQFHVEGLGSKDGFSFDADVSTKAELLPDKAELAGFLHSIVGSRRVIQREALASQFQPVVQGALAAFLGGQEAAHLVDATQLHGVAESVANALQAAFFSAGLSVEGPPSVALTSAMYRGVQKTREEAAARQAQHEATRQVDQALHAARADHIDRLADSLERLKKMAGAAPDVELPELIRTFSDQQRGQLYEALFADTDQPVSQTQWIVAACSDELLLFDAKSPAQPTRRLRIDGAAGPARSVQMADSGVLLVGAARGVYVWPIDRVSPERVFSADNAATVRGGFNSAVKVGGVIAATHSELGICEWDWNGGSLLSARFAGWTRAAKAVRNLAAFDGDLYCSVDSQVLRWRSDALASQLDAKYAGADAIITAIQPAREGLYAGTSEGDLLFWPAGTTENPDIMQRGTKRAIESIWMQQSHGVRRLIYTDTSPRVHARVLGDSFTFHYEAGGQTLRRVEVAPDLLVATNELRDRLILWLPGEPERPLSVIGIGALTGRNIQDVCLIPAAACS